MLERRLTPAILPALFVVALLASGAPARAGDGTYPGGLRPPLDRVLAAAPPDARIPVSVVLREQVDPQALRRASAGLARPEARRAIVRLLEQTARASQSPLLARLRSLEAQGRAARIRPLWIGNIVGLDATPEVVREIAARSEVAWVNHNPKADVFLGQRPHETSSPGLAASEPGAARGGTTPADITAEIECGVGLMRAPEVWNDLGVTGEGAVVAVIDTGVCWTHPDITNQIWVNPGEDLDHDGAVMDSGDENGVDDDANGFVDDLIGWDFEFNDNEPEDTNSHGSHCAGTVAGDGAGGTQTGMAPDARIMVVKVGVTFADEVDVWSGMQYAADNGADAISMSLGWPHNQNPDRATWRQNCENTMDAGTAMVIAAGNEGSGAEPDNVRTPGDVPRVITVGALDCGDVAAGFSSRGPITWQGVPPWNDHPYPPGLTKPDISGPGVDTKSDDVCSGYSFKSGTSMATPHVAGAVALMMSANPGLGHDQVKQVLEDTSVDLGAVGKDNTYGSGRVDAYAAVTEIFGLTLESVTVQDDDLNLANADGGVDTGEIVTLVIRLRNNRDDLTATRITATLSTGTPGVSLVHDWGRWPDAVPGSTVESMAPHFSVRVEAGCNFFIDFLLSVTDDTRTTQSRFRVRVGSPFERTLLADSFETDQGWTVSSTATTGLFVRVDPRGIRDSQNNFVQPEDDVTASPGTLCWVTGNGGSNAGDDDVDSGLTRITSPIVDATNVETATFHYWRWFYAFPSTFPSSDFFRTFWSRDGVSFTIVEELGGSQAAWTERNIPLPASAFGPGLRVRFEVDDSPVTPLNSTVEGLVDEVSLSGTRYECDLFVPPVVAPPNPVGDSLLVSRVGNDVRLDWTPPPVDGGHAAATLYRVYRSAQPDAGFTQQGLSREPWHLEAGEAAQATTVYFLVVSENGGGTSGEGP